MLKVMVYSGAIALVLSLMGLCIERLAGHGNLARRRLWLGVMVLSLAWPAMAILLADPSSGNLRQEAALVVPGGEPVIDAMAPALLQPVASDALMPVEAAAWSLPSDRTLLLAWGATSLALLLGLIATSLHLRLRASRWQRRMLLEREVLVSESTGPALLGTLRPRIVVPRWLIDEPAARQAMVLLHESQHIAARDPLLLRLAALLVVAVPWNLPMWWQLRRLRQSIELDCDARVLREGARPAEYGALLLAVARRAAHVPAGLVALGEPVSALEMRIRNLTPQQTRRSPAGALLAFLLLAGGAAVAATLEAPRLPQRATEPAAPVAAEQSPAKPESAPLTSAPAATAQLRSAEALPLLPAPPSAVPSPKRRQAVERAIIENHPELLSGPERDGSAFLTVRIRTDGSIEQSTLRYVEAGDEAGLAAATAGASAARDPNGGQLLLARGTPLESGATVRSQVHAHYTMLYPREEFTGRSGGTPHGASLNLGDLEKVLAHYLPDALTEAGAAKGTPWLILSQEGRVIRSGIGGSVSMQGGRSLFGRFKFPISGRQIQMVVVWTESNQ